MRLAGFLGSVVVLALVFGGCGGDDENASASCAPRTCANLGFDCGETDDGCGGRLTCGTCKAPQTCGGGGQPNRCGQPPGTVTNVEVEGQTNRQIRQGASQAPSNTTYTMILTGQELADTTAVTAGEGDTLLPTELVEVAATRVVTTIRVNHGVGLGPRQVHVVTKRGVIDVPIALGPEVTPITASVATGSDTTGDGTDERPFKTLTNAAKFAQRNDVIALKNGTYDAASGEVFSPITGGIFDGNPSFAAGVQLVGESSAGTRLVGPGRAVPNGPDARMGLVLDGDAIVGQLTIEGFLMNVRIKSGTVGFRDVDLVDAGIHDVYVDGTAVVDFTDARLRKATTSGIVIFGGAQVHFTNGRISQNDLFGVLFQSTASFRMDGTEVDENDYSGNAGNNVGGFLGDGSGSITLGPMVFNGVNFHDNKRNGLDVRGSATATTVDVVNSQFRRDAVYAIGFGDNVGLRMTGTTIELPTTVGGECTNSGIYLGGSPTYIELGDTSTPGENQFLLAATGGCYGIRDERPASKGAIRMRTTSFSNTEAPTTPAANCYSATSDRKWLLANPGSCPATGNIVTVLAP